MRALAGEEVSDEVVRFVRRDGSLLWVEVHADPLHHDDGMLYGAVAGFDDVTRRVEQDRRTRDQARGRAAAAPLRARARPRGAARRRRVRRGAHRPRRPIRGGAEHDGPDREALAEPIAFDGTHLGLGAAIGVATLPTDGGNAPDPPAYADLGMYAAKGARNGTLR